MQDFDQILRTRRAVRHFTSEPVSNKHLQAIVEAAFIAPSAKNNQPWRLIAIQSPEAKKKLHPISVQPWFVGAPLYIVIVGNHLQAWRNRPYSSVNIDTSIAMTQMWLKAHQLGLGANWVCAFNQSLCHCILGIEEPEEAVSILAVGHPDPNWIGKEGNSRRKNPADLLTIL